jgi:ATP-dependent Lon protease
MRDFRDAKTMAQTLRDSLTSKAVPISHSESLELVSKMFGVADWNTLSAMLKDQRQKVAPDQKQQDTASYPAIPVRDYVPFPPMVFPLFIGREKTMLALEQAFDHEREVVLAVQRQSAVDEPGSEDVYDVGVLARLLEVVRLPDNTMKALTQVVRRVLIRRFVGGTGAFCAEIAVIEEGSSPEAGDLMVKAVERFEHYAEGCDSVRPREIWPPLDQIRDAGRLADVIARHMILPLQEKQSLLANLEPLARLERVCALMDRPDAPTNLPHTFDPRDRVGSDAVRQR